MVVDYCATQHLDKRSIDLGVFVLLLLFCSYFVLHASDFHFVLFCVF